MKLKKTLFFISSLILLAGCSPDKTNNFDSDGGPDETDTDSDADADSGPDAPDCADFGGPGMNLEELCVPTPGWTKIEASDMPFTDPTSYGLTNVATTDDGKAYFYSRSGYLWRESTTIPIWSFDGTEWELHDAVQKIPFHERETRVLTLGNSVVAANSGSVAVFDGSDWSQIREHTRYTAIWGAPDGKVFLSTGGEVLMDDGAGPAATQGVDQVGIFALWGTSSSDVYGVGYHGVFSHFDGTSWSALPSIVSSSTENFYELWGAGPSEIYTGYSDYVRIFDGTSWSSHLLGLDEEVLSIEGVGSNDVYALTEFHYSGGGDELVEYDIYRVHHYDGTNWSLALELSNDGYGWSVDALGVLDSGEVFFVRRGGPWDMVQLVELGGASAVLNLDSLPMAANNISRITGTSSNDIHMMGQNNIIAHYDGSAWTEHLAESESRVTDISSSGISNDRVAVTHDGTYLFWDGSTWAIREQGQCNYISALCGTGPDDLYIVCGDPYMSVRKTYHYDGSTWQVFTDWEDALGSSTSIPVFFDDGSGLAIASTPSGPNLALWDGASWNMYPLTMGISGLFGTSADDLYSFIQFEGRIYSLGTDHMTWNEVYYDSDLFIVTAAMGSADDIVVLGRDGLGAYFDGAAWSRLDLCFDYHLDAASISQSGVAYIMGSGGQIWRREAP